MNDNVRTMEDNRGLFTGPYGEAIEHVANYQFPVEERPMVVQQEDQNIEILGKRAIVRTDTNTVLGVVGSNYKLLSHAEALDPILDHFENRNVATFKRIAITQGGARMFANVYFPNMESSVKVGKKNDKFWPGITIINSLDGTLKYHIEASIYRLICTNGMRIPIIIDKEVSVHSKNKDFASMMNSFVENLDKNKDKFGLLQDWANITIKRDSVESEVDKLFKNKKFNFPVRYRDLVLDEIQKEEQFGTVTVWNLYNAFNSVIEHHLIREKGKYDRTRLLDENMFRVFNNVYANKK